ncbi:hypothetical protein [Floridanema aerugineum]|uniref:Uncharacterized protein n=1 Tax=Floridaenema aerugineum BLCC-F46 TaxID=3153654 RepID=A0ABV4XBR6_9CYAN
MMLERMARDTRNVKAINALTEVLDNSEAQEALYTVADILLAIDPGNQTAINVLSRWFPSGMQSGWARTLWQTQYANQIPTKVDFTGVDETIKDKNTYDEIIWNCAQNMTYPEFYQVWHYYPTTTHPEAPDNIPATFSPSFQSLEIQIADISSQLQPTAQTYPLYIDAQALVGETNIATLAQEICTQIYLAASLDSELPQETVNSAAQLKTKIIQVKNRLQKQHLALIFHNCQPHTELVNFSRKLLPGLNNFLHIAWITEVPIEPPLRGFPPNQPNLSSVMQSWIDEIE